MALPTLAKTYQFNVNQRINAAAELEFHQRTMLAIKDALVGFATQPWIVKGSSNGTTAGMDDVDRWTTFTDLVWGTGAHSWIVLQNGGDSNIYVLIDLNFSNTTPQQASFTMAFSPFTGGSTSAAPTSTASFGIAANTNRWFGENTTTGTATSDAIINVWKSTDSEVTRVVTIFGGVPVAMWSFEKIQNPRTNHAIPWLGCINSSATPVNLLTSVNMGFNFTTFYSRHGSLNFSGILLGLGRNTNTTSYSAFIQDFAQSGDNNAASSVEEIDNVYWMYEVQLFSHVVGARGPKGKRFDLWWGQYQVANHGDTYPNDTSRQFVEFGCFVFPWNGSVPVLI